MINKIWLPRALLAGVEYSLFWELNPKKLEPFNEYYRLKQENELKQLNFQTWLQGVYFQASIASAFDKNSQYYKEPLPLFEDNSEKSEEEEIKKKALKFSALVQMFNSEFRNREGG